jgi:hypothetical protein
MRADNLCTQLRALPARLPHLLTIVLVIASGLAALQSISQWHTGPFTLLNPAHADDDACITWLRQQYPDHELSVRWGDYKSINTFLRNHVRTWDVQADFDLMPLPPTIGDPALNLNAIWPEFAYARAGSERQYLRARGYHLLRGSPMAEDRYYCGWQRGNIFPYVYGLVRPVAESLQSDVAWESSNWGYSTTGSTDWPGPDDLPAGSLITADAYRREADYIAVRITANRLSDTVLTVQERAYPGWRVEVNGQPAQIESFGGQIAVVLPPGDAPVEVYFEYRPPLLLYGGVLTILSAIACTGYLLTRRSSAEAAC